jgi:UDP-2-acetamido-3-amino-2,3-dideoxy-glucuronate N-acetyltransferase
MDYITLDLELKQPLEEELLHFVDCVKTRKTPKTDGEEGLMVLKVLEEAQGKF